MSATIERPASGTILAAPPEGGALCAGNAGDAGIDRASLALAGDADHPPRQQRPPQPREGQGRRPPGLLRLGGDDPDRPLLLLPAPRRPRLHQAARLPGLPRRAVPARPARPLVSAHAARLRRLAGLSLAHERPGHGRFLHRLGRARRRGPGLRRPGRPLRRDALRRGLLRPLRRPHRRRRAGRGERLGGGRRGVDPGARQRHLDHRPQPAEPRPRHPRRARGAAEVALRQRRLEGLRGQVRLPAGSGHARTRRRGAAPAHRRDEQRGVPGPDPPPRRRRAAPPPGRRVQRDRCQRHPTRGRRDP